MIRKIINFLIYTVVLFLPLYLVRFSLLGVPTNPVEVLVIIVFLLWIFEIKILPFLKGDVRLGQRDFYGNATKYIARIIKVKIPPAPFTKGEGLNFKHSLPKIYWFSFILIFLGIIISAVSNQNYLSEAGIIKGWFIIPFLFFLVLLDQIDSREKIERLLKILYTSTVGVSIISLPYLLSGQLTFDGRLAAFYLSPNYLAMFLAPGIIIGFFRLLKYVIPAPEPESTFLYFSRFRVKPGMTFIVSGLVLMLTAFYFTFSYGAWLAVFFSLIVTLGLTKIFNQAQKMKFGSTLIFLFLILMASQLFSQKLKSAVQLESRSSFSSRLMIWQSAWKIGKDNSIWGIGPGNFQTKYLEYQKYFPPYLEWAVPQPHNLYLAFWLQSGLLGLTGFILLVGYWMKAVLKMMRNKKDGPWEAALLAIIFYTLIHGLVDTPYWKNDLALLFWIVLALGIKFQTIQMPIHSIDEKEKTFAGIQK